MDPGTCGNQAQTLSVPFAYQAECTFPNVKQDRVCECSEVGVASLNSTAESSAPTGHNDTPRFNRWRVFPVISYSISSIYCAAESATRFALLSLRGSSAAVVPPKTGGQRLPEDDKELNVKLKETEICPNSVENVQLCKDDEGIFPDLHDVNNAVQSEEDSDALVCELLHSEGNGFDVDDMHSEWNIHIHEDFKRMNLPDLPIAPSGLILGWEAPVSVSKRRRRRFSLRSRRTRAVARPEHTEPDSSYCMRGNDKPTSKGTRRRWLLALAKRITRRRRSEFQPPCKRRRSCLGTKRRGTRFIRNNSLLLKRGRSSRRIDQLQHPICSHCLPENAIPGLSKTVGRAPSAQISTPKCSRISNARSIEYSKTNWRSGSAFINREELEGKKHIHSSIVEIAGQSESEDPNNLMLEVEFGDSSKDCGKSSKWISNDADLNQVATDNSFQSTGRRAEVVGTFSDSERKTSANGAPFYRESSDIVSGKDGSLNSKKESQADNHLCAERGKADEDSVYLIGADFVSLAERLEKCRLHFNRCLCDNSGSWLDYDGCRERALSKLSRCLVEMSTLSLLNQDINMPCVYCKDGLRVWKEHIGSNRIACRATFMVPVTPRQYCEFASDMNLRKEWDHNVTAQRVIQQFDSSKDLFHIQFKRIGALYPRDLLTLRIKSKFSMREPNVLSDPVRYSRGWSIRKEDEGEKQPDESYVDDEAWVAYHSTSCSVDHKEIPEGVGHVRMTARINAYLAKPVTGKFGLWTEVTLLNESEPGGWVPAVVSQALAAKLLPMTVEKFSKGLLKR